MTRRVLLLSFIALVALASCRDDGKKGEFSPQERELLAKKVDARAASLAEKNDTSPFAAIVVFRSDAFVSQSLLLDSKDLPVLDAFGNAAIILMRGSDIRPLLQIEEIRKIRHFCAQGALVRFHPSLEMEVLKSFSAGKEDEPVSMMIRFRDEPSDAEGKFIESAGFTIRSRAGGAWSITGPPSGLPRLLENERIIYYEGASKTRHM